MPKTICMIPARYGSKRLKVKNLREIDGIPMLVRAMRKAKALDCFDEVWVNSESDVFGDLARDEGVPFHKRPDHLAVDTATSEDFVNEFLLAHPCDYLVQMHSIAPLLQPGEVVAFVEALETGDFDTLLSGVDENIHCMHQLAPVNFSFTDMGMTQDLKPLQRISWSLTGWKASGYTREHAAKRCETFHGKVGFFPLSRLSGWVVKHEEDYLALKALAEAGLGG
ncbi:MAG: cytidyltransferase [Pseudomonadota bacterium]